MIHNCTVTTACGTLQGVPGKEPGTVAFKGIRYATAGRWEYPRPVTGWQGVWDASRFGACCWQPRAFYEEAAMPKKAFYYNEFRKGETYTYSEDCLFLNIWVPEKAEHAPVLFYIHGGGFQGGCGHEKHFSGEAYCRQGVIVVTCNYRLGPLGFCCLPQLAQQDGHTGNYGLYDQLCALQWVRDNIAAFGGDADKITLMGQSAGAMSVQQHSISPLSAGLFHRAILLSGGGASKLLSPCTAQQAYPFWQAVAQQAGCADNLAALRTLHPRALFAAYDAVRAQTKNSMRFCGPVLDGTFLLCSASQAAKAGSQHNIPYLVCTTSEDMLPPILFQMAQRWALLQHKQKKQPSYAAFFSRQLPGDTRGAWHSADLWYAFGTLSNGWRPFTPWDYTLSKAMVTYYANFVKTGNPNGSGLPVWQPVCKPGSKAMLFGNRDIRMGSVNRLRLLYTMLTKPNVGE